MPGQPLHFVLCDHGKHGLAWAERDPKDMTREETIKDIKYGQLKNVRQVLAVDMSTMASTDATAEILQAVAEWHGVATQPIAIFGETQIMATDNDGNYGFGLTEEDAIAQCLQEREVA